MNHPRRSKYLLPSIIVIAMMLIGAGVYLYQARHSKPQPIVAAPVVVDTVVKASDQPASTTTSNYVSNGSALNLGFDYPSNWTVSPSSGNNPNDQTINVNSPLTNIVGADGKSVVGKVTISLRPASALLTELSGGAATVAQDSVQFAYTKPTTAQYQYPYLIFIHLLGGSNPTSAFEEVLVSGHTKFAKGASITDSNIAVDPIITANFYSCKTNACAGSAAVSLSITNDTWLKSTLFQQTLAVFKSLRIN